MKLVDTSVRRPVGVIMVVIAALILGAVSLKNLAVDLYPEIDFPIVAVATTYEGAAPQEVEELVSKPLESSVSTIEGIENVQSTSQPDSSLVMLQFDWGRDIDNAMTDVREAIDQVKGSLPDDANDPSVLRFDPQQIPVMWVGLEGADTATLQNLAEDELQPFFERQEGVGSLTIEGGQTREIQVALDRARLNFYGVTPQQVAQALGSENASASAGSITKGTKDVQVRVEGEFDSVAEIEKTLISLPAGGTVKVKDLGSVNDTFKDQTSYTEVNGETGVVMSVLKQSDANTVKVADNMYDAIDEMQETLPEEISLNIVMDTSTFIRQSIQSVVNNMIMGGIFSVLVLLLFLRSIRATLVIGLSIPIAIIVTFTLMYFTGETLNILSMGGLALGVGMMVDSSIVILENIFKYRQKGYNTFQAAKLGASELASAVIASTLTTVVVFLPIIFVDGIAAELFTPLAKTVAFALTASLVAAITLIPMLSSKMLGNVSAVTNDEESSNRRFDRLFNRLKERYARFLKWGLGHRKTVFFGTGGLVIASFLLVPLIGTEFIPASDQGQIEVKVETPSGTTLDETKHATQQVEQFFEPYNDVIQSNYLTVGGGGIGSLNAGSNMATFTVQLVEPSERDITTAEVIQGLSQQVKKVPGADVSVAEFEGGGAPSTGNPVQVKINGDDWEVLEDLAQQVQWLIEDVDGTVNVETSTAEGKPELQVQVNREVASQYGLTYQDVMNEVELAFGGQIATRLKQGGDETDVTVLLPEDKRSEIADLKTMFIQSSSGQSIPLSAVADVVEVEGPVEISRENQQRQVNVTSDIRDRDLGSVSADVQKKLQALNMPDGYSYSMGGDSEDMQESFTNLALALLLSIFLVYTVMAIQFESFVYPFVIMFSLPTTIIGVLVGLFVTGKPLSITAFIGLIMLAGIVVNNAIVLVDYINILRDRGKERFEAMVEAGRSRLRPILMTTLTTVLAMVPIGLGIGQGAESQAPMAVVIIFGLSFSMMFTLVYIPVMYTYIDDFSNWIKRKIFRKGKNDVVTGGDGDGVRPTTVARK